MTPPIGKAQGEGNCARATQGGEEAGASAARLRTETFYKAGRVGRVSQTSRSRSQLIPQVKNERAQRQITLLPGETCTAVMRGGAAPRSKAGLKARNGSAKVGPGGAGVSRGRSTEDRTPPIPGRTER